MVDGFIFDLWALAFAAVIAGTAWLVVTMVQRRIDRPFDWQKDAPEFRLAKDAHVKKLDW